jgi:hypothetical protein
MTNVKHQIVSGPVVPEGVERFVREHQIPARVVGEWLGCSVSVAGKKLRGEVRWSYEDLVNFSQGANVPLKSVV